MNSSSYENYLLICFVEIKLNLLTGLVFNPENLNYLYLIPSNENINNIKYIKTTVSKDKKKLFYLLWYFWK